MEANNHTITRASGNVQKNCGILRFVITGFGYADGSSSFECLQS